MSKASSLCDQCKRGHLFKLEHDLSFVQHTDRGNIQVNATIPVWVCDVCGAKTWDEAADKIVDELVRQEYDRRFNR